MHVLGFMNVDEGMAGEYFTDMLVLFALELDTREHGKALVCNTLLEVIVGVNVLLSLRFTPLRHGYGLRGNTIDQMSQEFVSIMWIIVVKLSSKLVFDIGDIDKVPVSDEIGGTPFLREHVVKNVTEWFGFSSFFFVCVSDKVSNEGFVM